MNFTDLTAGILDGSINERNLMDHLHGEEGFRLAVLKYLLDLTDAALNSSSAINYAQTVKTDPASVTGTAAQTLISVTINDVQAGSAVKIDSFLNLAINAGSGFPGYYRLLRGATVLLEGDANGLQTRATASFGPAAAISTTVNVQSSATFIDETPNVGSNTYNLQFFGGDATVVCYLNRCVLNRNIAGEESATASVLIATEITQ